MSTVKTDNVYNSIGNPLLKNGYPRQPGRIIEYLTNECDGSEVRGETGVYTWPTVTSQQVLLDTYADLTGSAITYTPPEGTTKVVYKFHFAVGYDTTEHAIGHFKLFIGGVEVTSARHNRSSRHPNSKYNFEWIFNIGRIASPAEGRQLTWTIPKTIKMQVRRYGVNNFPKVHLTRIWDGVDVLNFSVPSLTLIAIA